MANKGLILFLACPYCGRSASLNQLSNRSFDNYSIDWALLQFREAKGGRGRGGFFVAKQGFSLKEMLKDAKFRPLAKKVIARLKLIHDTWEKEGLFAEV